MHLCCCHPKGEFLETLRLESQLQVAEILTLTFNYPIIQLPNYPFSDGSLVIDWTCFLTRPIFSLCPSQNAGLFAAKTILITGAAGSIGSALFLFLMEGLAKQLILLDRSAENMRRLYRKYQQRNLTLPAVEFIQADILDRETIEHLFARHRPDIVFHAAAMKHLPELESNAFAALENNVAGTLRLFEAAKRFGVECFVNVSTDKAVNPTSILGISKRLTELFLPAMESPSQRTISLRLGNVLGSSGSVVPILVEALRRGLPLEITDPQASRYFLTLKETAALLVQSSLAPASALLLPKMGRPRKILDLARFLHNEFAGKRSVVAMKFTGLKDGEKRSEQLTFDHESLRHSISPHLDEVCSKKFCDRESFVHKLDCLLDQVLRRNARKLIHGLPELVPEFHPSLTFLQSLRG